MFGFSVPGGVAVLVGKTDARVRVHKLEADGLKEITGTGESDLVRDESGYRVALAELVAELIHTPGHTPGRQRFPLLDRLVSGDMSSSTAAGASTCRAATPTRCTRR